MHPILFRFGSTIIYTYTILLDVGLVCGLVVACLEGKRRGIAPERIVDAALWAVVAGIAGGRVGYVLANQEYFAENFREAFYVWEGGLAFQGAFLAGLLALFLYSAYHKLPFLALADTAAMGLALGQVFGWLGCLMSGCAYGLESHGATSILACLSLYLPDIYGISAPRFATQPLASALSLATFILLWATRRRWPFDPSAELRASSAQDRPFDYSGFAFTLYLLLYAGGQFLLEFIRGDEAIYWGPWRVSQWIYLAEAALALVFLAYLSRKFKSSLTKL
ncbi:MAG: prolipoprotein diacylglyceryl transferase [Anaerolineales bacterium]|nr:MAG: prolipoprotein diacylglyceryl transferase [Anaerolineales bacterium]